MWKRAAWGSYQKMIRIQVSFQPVWNWHLVKQLHCDLTLFPVSPVKPTYCIFILFDWPYMMRIAQCSTQHLLCYSPYTLMKVKRPCIWPRREDNVGRYTIETWVTLSCCLGFIIIIWMPGLVLASRLPLSLTDTIKYLLIFSSMLFIFFLFYMCV